MIRTHGRRRCRRRRLLATIVISTTVLLGCFGRSASENDDDDDEVRVIHSGTDNFETKDDDDYDDDGVQAVNVFRRDVEIFTERSEENFRVIFQADVPEDDDTSTASLYELYADSLREFQRNDDTLSSSVISEISDAMKDFAKSAENWSRWEEEKEDKSYYDDDLNNATTDDSIFDKNDDEDLDEEYSRLLLEMDKELSVVDSEESEMKILSLMIRETFDNATRETPHEEEQALRTIREDLEARAALLAASEQRGRDDGARYHDPYEKDHDRSTILLSLPETWSNAGYEVVSEISPAEALSRTMRAPVHTYRLRRDSRRETTVEGNERRTRRHAGVLSSSDNEPPSHHFARALVGAVRALDERASALGAMLEAALGSTRDAVRETEAVRARLATLPTPLSELAVRTARAEADAAAATVESLAERARGVVERRAMREEWRREDEREDEEEEARREALELKYRHGALKDVVVVQTEAYAEVVDGLWTARGRMEALKNETERELAHIKDEATAKTERITAAIFAEADRERNRETQSLLEIRVLGEEARRSVAEAIRAVFVHLREVLRETAYETEGRRRAVFVGVALTLLVFAVSASKEAVACGFRHAKRSLTAPRLVREYGRRRRDDVASASPPPVLPPSLSRRLDAIPPGRHILLYGPPGCGKTTTARWLASRATTTREHGRPYAITSGADLSPSSSGRDETPTVLRSLLVWASNRGAVVVVDEAECALGRRDPNRPPNDSLNVLLSMTGDNHAGGDPRRRSGASGGLSLILTTRRPSALDGAVLDRVDEVVEMPSPEERERLRLLEQEFRTVFARTTTPPRRRWFGRPLLRVDPEFRVERALAELAKRTAGFSGRDLMRVVTTARTKVFLTDDLTLNARLWDETVSETCHSVRSKKELVSVKRN